MIETRDIVIVGAGTAGLSALREVRKQTDNFAIVNAGAYGTTCARVGCMPSKLLIEAANHFFRRNDFAAFGITGAEHLRIDVPAVMRRVRQLRDEFVAGIVRLTADLGDRNIAGHARLLAPDELQIGERRLRAQRIIIATGSRPVLPQHWLRLRGPVFTSDTIFEAPEFPRRMAVIGLGAVGVEIAQALSRLGVEVLAFGSGKTLCGLDDPIVNARAIALLGREISVALDCDASLHEDAAGLQVHNGKQVVTVDAAFAALGRQPNIEGLGLETLGVPLDAQGMPELNPHTLQAANLPVYFAGDVASDLPVLHVANDEGHIAAYNALREKPTCFQRRVPLTIVFTDPNIAIVGARLRELNAATIAIGTVDFANQGRARIARENRGVLRIYADRKEGLILGAQMCAPRAEHLAQLLALAIGERATVQSLLRMPFYHPVFEEGLRTALRDAARQITARADSDLAACEPVGAPALD